MLAMPMLLLRMRFRTMFLIGLAAWALRFALFAAAVPFNAVWMIWAGILLHGICFDFVFVAGRVYVDGKVEPAIRAQAHGLLVVITLGIGQLLGAPIAGWLFHRLPGTHVQTLGVWQHFWMVPTVLCVVVLGLFGWLFRENGATREE